MRRGLDYGIWFGKREEFHIIRQMTLKQGEGKNIRETYLIEGLAYNAPYSPADVAELRAAIDEMERMHDQHRDALTDGAAQQIPGPALWGDPFGEGRLSGKLEKRGKVTEDGSPSPPLDPEVFDFDALRTLAIGEVLLHNTQNNTSWLRSGNSISVYSFETMQERSLIVANGPKYVRRHPVIVRAYRITDAGRALLAAQTPEAEACLDTSEATILQALSGGDDLLLDHANHTAWFRVSLATIHESHIKALWDKGLLSVDDPSVAEPDNVLAYTISAKGRRVLAEQEA